MRKSQDTPVEKWLYETFHSLWSMHEGYVEGEVSAKEFYREIFPEGELEKRGEHVTGKYCGIAVQIPKDGRVKRFSVTDDLDVIDELVASDDFCVMSPISYAGKSQRQEMARFMYALTIDLDGLIIKEDGDAYGLRMLWYQMTGIRNTAAAHAAHPVPTFIVSSGTGVHLYYVFEKPVPLFPNVIKQLHAMRHFLVTNIWNKYVTTLSKNKQYESVTQAFRMVGSVTKDGRRVRAWRTGSKVSVEYLNEHVPDSAKITRFSYKSDLPLAQAKEKYPEWYQRRIVEGKPKGSWTASRALYDWWLEKSSEGIGQVREGHRYFYIMCLAIYARKCGISQQELEDDAYKLIRQLDKIGDSVNNPFTREDVTKALEAYNATYQTFPRYQIELLSGISMPPNKRNGRKQLVHLKGARAIRDINDEANGTDWRYHGGAPTKQEQVRAWRKANPEGRKIDCERETGLSRHTVLKWWAAD